MSPAARNMLRCAADGRLVVYDWTRGTICTLLGLGLIRVDGPWIYITSAGRDALARAEAA